MWLLQSSPLTSWELLMAKFWGGFVPLVVIAELLIVTSNALLHTTTLLSILSAVSVFFLAIAISGMAVGLGASHPRYDVADGAQVATGYAGFLLMVISALLILVSVTVLAWPLYHSFRATWLGSGVGMRDWIGLAGGRGKRRHCRTA